METNENCGIYKITNLINGKCYIGQSRNIKTRWRQHKYSAFNPNNNTYNYPLYRAFRKYGLENFSFEVIELCSLNELNNLEIKYIEYFNSFFNGYNLTLGGDSSGTEINKEKIIGVIKDLETTDMFHREIAEKWDISIAMVQGINTGRYWRQNRDYPIQKSSIKRQGHKIYHYCSICGKEISRFGNRCISCYAIERRKTERPSREKLKQMIKEKSFTEIGRMFNVSDNAIRKWCDAENLPRKKSEINQYTDEEWEKI